jgi:hypothetical protein
MLVVSTTINVEVIVTVESSVIVEGILVESLLMVVTTNSVLVEVMVLISRKVLRIMTGRDAEGINEVKELKVVKAPRADETSVGPGEVARAIDSVPLVEEEAVLVTAPATVDMFGKSPDSLRLVDDKPNIEETLTTVGAEDGMCDCG